MLEIKINSPVPIYEQLITGIKSLIESGELKEGESLPSIRALSKNLEVAPNTVAKSYAELDRMGYLQSFGVKGTFVSHHYKENDDKEPELALKRCVRWLVNDGYSLEELSQLVGELFNEINSKK